MDSLKKWLIFLAVLIPIIIVLTLLAINYGGWGTSLSEAAIPITNGIHEIGKVIPNMMLENGYIMLLCYLSVPILMFGAALIYWNKDWGYKLQPANTTTGGFQTSTTQTIPVSSLQTATTTNPFNNQTETKKE